MTSSLATDSINKSYNKLKSRVVYGPKFHSRYRTSTSTGGRTNKKDEPLQVTEATTAHSLGSTTRMSYYGTGTSDAKTPQLHKKLTKENIERLHQHFKGHEMEKLDRRELRDTFEKFSIYYTDDEFENLFLKVNTDRDDMVDWDELVSYMLLGFEDDFGDKAKESLDPPIKEKPVTRRTRQRYQIVRIDFFPVVLADQGVNMKQGAFVTVGIDGTVNFYNLDWELQRIGKSPSRKCGYIPCCNISKTFFTKL